jgi:hypothetical protein
LTDRAGTNYYLLTCGHCIATSHEPSPDIGPVLHHGKPIANIVSLLWKDHKQWTIDAAIARSEGPDRVGDFLLSTGEVRGTRKVRNTYHFVKKSGAVTHHTTGGILSLSANLPVLGPSGRVFYRRQLGIHTEPSVGPFASDGDSGSLVLDKDNYVVGLLVAGDPTTPYYIATPIDRVLEAVKEALNVPLRFITYP